MAGNTDFPASPSAPFWVEFAPQSVRGLDLLGLRLPVQSIGLSLLNGVTTISPKVRYISFRTFIADAYRTLPGPPTDSLDAFNAFAVPAEAAFALGNALVDPDATNIVGVDRARRLLEESGTTVPLQKLANQLAVAAYASPAQDLNLVGVRPEGAPSIDPDRGLPLATALRQDWGRTAIGARILDGSDLTEATLQELEEFGRACRLSELKGAERRLLIEAVLPAEPHRREIERLRTYALLLHLADEMDREQPRLITEADLMRAARRPRSSLPEVLVPALDGWLIYQVRDSLAVSHEAALGQVVAMVGAEGPGPEGLPHEAVLDSLLRDRTAVRDLWGDLGLPAQAGALDLRISDVRALVQETCSGDLEVQRGLRRWDGRFDESEVIGARRSFGTAALLLPPLSWLLAEWRAGPGMEEGLPGFDALSLGGTTRLGMHDVLLPRLEVLLRDDAPLSEVMAELAVLTVQQHVEIALSRLAQDPRRDVAVLLMEGGSWIKLRDYTPGRTASRIPQAIDWLRQLNLISPEGTTPDGAMYRERATTALERMGPE